MKKAFEVIGALITVTIFIIFRYMSNVIISVFLPWANTTKIDPNQQIRADEIIRVAFTFTIYFLLTLF